MRRHDEIDDDGRRDHERDDPGAGWTRRRERPGAKPLALVLVAVILLIFVLQNTDRAHVDFLLWDGAFPLWTMIVTAAVLGFFGGWIVGRLYRSDRRARRSDRELRRR